AGVPCGPINNLEQVFADPQVQARGLKIRMEHPLSGELELVANPIRLSRTPVSYRLPPPMLDQHGSEVLREWLVAQ
ncbi:MAG: CoA transferase, partial [Pseudomonas sp.]|nr:CoA transferase [Pseudomonas sp.]